MSAAIEILPLRQPEGPLAQVIPLPTPARLLSEHLDLLSQVAGRMAPKLPPSIELGDLIGAGALGLLDAVARYNPGLKVPFRAYAEIRIRGAILDALRGLDWASRSTRRQVKAMQRAEHGLLSRLGRPAEDLELATEAGMSVESVRRLREELAARSIEARDVSAIEDEACEAPNPFDALCQRYDEERVRRGLEALPPREREVLRLSFFEDRTLRDIGDRLGVTESRACQLRNQGLARLRRFYEAQA